MTTADEVGTPAPGLDSLMPEAPFEGTLEKRSEWMGTWQPRHVVLSKGKLQYFKEGCQQSRATFGPGDVLGVATEVPSTLLLRVRQAGGEERTFELRTPDEEAMQLWAQRFEAAFDLEEQSAALGEMGVERQSSTRSTGSNLMAATQRAATMLGAAKTVLCATAQTTAKLAGKESWLELRKEATMDTLAAVQKSAARLREQLENDVNQALLSCDDRKIEILLDRGLALGLQGEAARKASRRVAGALLRDAMQAEDPKRLKGALVAAQRLQAVDVPEFAPAVEKYKALRLLPETWNVAKMVLERQATGSARLLAKPVSDDIALRALVQLMFDRTMRRVWTRDRGKGKVPLYLQVVKVAEVQHVDKWVDYLCRRQAIMEETPEVPDDFLMANAESEKPLEEAQELCDASDTLHKSFCGEAPSDETGWRVRVAEGAGPGSFIEIPNPNTGEKLRLCLPEGACEGQEYYLSDLLAPCLPGTGVAPGLLEKNANEAWLFHGTRPIAAESITSDNFKIDLAGSSTGTLYGRGIYLSENATKADEYSHPDAASGLFTMLLCRATLGRILYTDEVQPDPRVCEDACLRGPYHSVLGDRKVCRGTFREFVVFDDDQVYANYIVHYKRLLPSLK